MNFLRNKSKNISLASIDFEKNAADYALFNEENKEKNIEKLKKELNDYSTKNYFAIIENGTKRLVGIIGFKNLIQSNQRSNIDLILSENIEREKRMQFGFEALNEISNYAYNAMNLYNLLVEETDFENCSMYTDAGYEYIGSRHYCVLKNGKLSNLYLFQKIPDLVSKSNMPEKGDCLIPMSNLMTIKDLPEIVTGKDIMLVRPSTLNDQRKNEVKYALGRSLNDFFDSSSMGEYKMIYNDYRLNKKLDNKNGFDYFILNKNGEPIGYVDRLHVDDKNLKTDVEINIFDKASRNKGYGSLAYQTYINILRQIGYVSIGSVVFSFNKPSIKLHESLKFNEYALRNESYFALGKLQDMHYYEVSFEDLDYSKTKIGK